LELVESKLHPPLPRPGMVPRTVLVDRLLAASAVPVVCVVAPAGYGKTTLLAQWARDKGSPVGWVSVDQRDNDPAVLLTYIAVALDRVEPLDPRVMGGLAGPRADVVGAVARLAVAVAAMTSNSAKAAATCLRSPISIPDTDPSSSLARNAISRIRMMPRSTRSKRSGCTSPASGCSPFHSRTT
jgi:hypothetical protein